jgi:ATP-binding cassette subfamily C protein LapB
VNGTAANGNASAKGDGAASAGAMQKMSSPASRPTQSVDLLRGAEILNLDEITPDLCDIAPERVCDDQFAVFRAEITDFSAEAMDASAVINTARGYFRSISGEISAPVPVEERKPVDAGARADERRSPLQTEAGWAETRSAISGEKTTSSAAGPETARSPTVPGIASRAENQPGAGSYGQTQVRSPAPDLSLPDDAKIEEVQDPALLAMSGRAQAKPQGSPPRGPSEAAQPGLDPNADDTIDTTRLAGKENAESQIANSMVPDPADVDYDPPLIECMAGLFKLFGKPVSTRLLVAGLPKTSGPLHPSAAIRAAQSAGLRAKTVYRPSLASISNITLPCILLLQGDKACILKSMNEKTAEVLFPENNMEPRTVDREVLSGEYLGYSIFAKPEPKLDKRASDIKLLESKRWFWGTLARFLPIYRHVFMASILVNLLAVCGPLFFMNVYDRVVPNHAVDTLWMLALGIGLAYIFDFILRNLRSYFVDVAGRNADVLLASKLMQHLLAMRLDVKPDSTGSLANNLREFESLRDFFGSTTLMALVDLPFLVFFIVLVIIIGGPIAIIPITAVPIVICAGFFLQFPLQQVAEKGFKENMQKNALLVEIINGLETIKTTMAEGRIQHAWEKVVGMSASSNNHTKRMSNLSVTLTIVVTQAVSVLLIIWGVYRISDGELSMGGLIACNMLAGRAMAPLSQVASMLTRLQQSRMALKSLDILMSLETEQPESGQYVDFGHLEHSLTLEDLSFKYPGTERFALEKVNVHIRPGEKVGVIGRMGSGKSTLGRMCVGLYKPTEGAVKLGGVDIRQLDMVDLRSRIGYIGQDNYLFYGTVRENISFGVVNADDRMVLRAANISGVTDFVRAHPAGFGMPVGERGMSLSGGQRQSVAIARALLQDTDILIMDEPSSNMDNSSELALKQRLSATLGNKTLILITHRLSMLDLADRLIVMDSGHVVADGPKTAVLNALRNEQLRIGGGGQRPMAPAGPPQGRPQSKAPSMTRA